MGNSFNHLYDFRLQIRRPKRRIFDCAMNSMQHDTTPVSRSCWIASAVCVPLLFQLVCRCYDFSWLELYCILCSGGGPSRVFPAGWWLVTWNCMPHRLQLANVKCCEVFEFNVHTFRRLKFLTITYPLKLKCLPHRKHVFITTNNLLIMLNVKLPQC